MNNLVKGSQGQCTPWHKGEVVGQKAPLRLSEMSAIRVRLEICGRAKRDAAESEAGGPVRTHRRNQAELDRLGSWGSSAPRRLSFPSRIWSHRKFRTGNMHE